MTEKHNFCPILMGWSRQNQNLFGISPVIPSTFNFRGYLKISYAIKIGKLKEKSLSVFRRFKKS